MRAATGRGFGPVLTEGVGMWYEAMLLILVLAMVAIAIIIVLKEKE